MTAVRSTHLNKFGFTLIELMIVVAIIGILASIAIPKFADLVRKAIEGATKGNLGTIRSAVNIYYNDMEGIYPQSTHYLVTNDAFTYLTINGKYLTAIPLMRTPYYHTDSSSENDLGAPAVDWTFWGYNANFGGDPNFGSVWVGCLHTDTKGTVWTAY